MKIKLYTFILIIFSFYTMGQSYADITGAQRFSSSRALDDFSNLKSNVSENEKIDDLLIYILFPQVGIQFLENRNNPDFFEPVPKPPSEGPKEDGVYTVKHNGQDYVVEVKSGGEISSIQVAGQAVATQAAAQAAAPQVAAPEVNAEEIPAPLAGNIWKVLVSPNQQVNEGDTLVILEAMKMETEVKAARAGTVVSVNVSEGDQVSAGQAIISLA